VAGYIDLHNHILPGIDDGPRTLKEAVKLARDLVSAGYSTVVVTPHACGGRPHPNVITERLAELQRNLDCKEVPLRLLPGAENHISPDLLELLEEKKALTLNNSRYLLMELPMLQPLPPYTEKLLQSLVAKGYCPVIPHPERVIVLNHRHEFIYKLYRSGAIYQVTWAAMLGFLGSAAKKTVYFMLRNNLVHLYATDAHHPATRLLTVNRAASILQEEQGREIALLMLKSRPKQIIENESIDFPMVTHKKDRSSSKAAILKRIFSFNNLIE